MIRSRSNYTTNPTSWLRFISLALLGFSGIAFGQQDAGQQYARVLKDADVSNRYGTMLEQRLAAQREEIQSLQQQLASLDGLAGAMQPLLQRMFDDLQAFIAADIPFHADKRIESIDKLRELMEQPETPPSEKFRRLIEVYEIEMEYGRTMDSYRAALNDGRDADFVRLGRVSLLYRTVDGAESGYWDHAKKAWVADKSYERAIERALRIAKQEEAPDLITVPVPAPTGGRS